MKAFLKWFGLRSVRYGILGLGALLLIGGFALLFEDPKPPSVRERNPSSAAVELAKLDSPAVAVDQRLKEIQEEASLRDPSPLFLPTSLNSAQSVRPESGLREPGDSFRGFPAKLHFSPSSLSLSLPAPVDLPEKPAEELGRIVWDRPFSGFGQKKQPSVQFPARDALLELRAAGDGTLLLSLPVEGLALPENIDWRPCEFLVRTDATGMLGQAPLLSSSGSEAVDRSFSEYLVRQWTLIERKARLPIGTYRIILGP